jgi:hypothetical protein
MRKQAFIRRAVFGYEDKFHMVLRVNETCRTQNEDNKCGANDSLCPEKENRDADPMLNAAGGCAKKYVG